MSGKQPKKRVPQPAAFTGTSPDVPTGGAFKETVLHDLGLTEISDPNYSTEIERLVRDHDRMLEQEEQLFLERTAGSTKNRIEQASPATRINKPETLGDIIHATRKRMKLSQQKFADLTGVGRRFISELENGKPTLEFGLVLQVCEAAGIDILARRK